MAVDEQRPGDGDEHCPSWCVSDHATQEYVEDRYHDSAGSYVDVLLDTRLDAAGPDGEPDADASGTDGHGRATELLVVTSRRVGEREDWTFVGEPDRRGQRLQLSRESARRLATALARHLDTLDAPRSSHARG